MKTRKPLIQQDLWPELKSPLMAFYAGAAPTTTSTPACRSNGEGIDRGSEIGASPSSTSDSTDDLLQRLTHHCSNAYRDLFASSKRDCAGLMEKNK